ncbi:hypothetical protein [Frondihabitans sp. PAMC 28766]|uniref:hypothetical protein n=1 Tax=Frondihabitans sp. PAMC 28766 TaxID=1795630 RepID=UPI003514DA8E
MTWVDSGWLMSIVVSHQPHFPHLPAGYSDPGVDPRRRIGPHMSSQAHGRHRS